MTKMFAQMPEWARGLKRDVLALWLAARDPRTPWYAKAVAATVAAYALSPIDPIPDFIPVLGYLDDIIIVPLGIMLAIKLVPPAIMEEHRQIAASSVNRPKEHCCGGGCRFPLAHCVVADCGLGVFGVCRSVMKLSVSSGAKKARV